MHNVLFRIIGGFGVSSIVTFIALTTLLIQGKSPAIQELWVHVTCNMLLGITFGLSSFLFEYERWSPLRQLATHFGLTLTVFFAVNLWAQWIPLRPLPLLIGLGIYIVNYTISWFAISWYYRKQAEELNHTMNRK
ncbi:DUF3021 domain-containing protein [Paenibacillus sp. 1P07SE]|uniref:DUF3021 domain-containing protein n=1 Tax=Paenibacillus sp. 1P07SE TaxID=3132209 RepID=UPI0039A6DF3B